MKVHDAHSTHPTTVISVALLLLAATGGAAWWTWQASTPSALAPRAASIETGSAPTVLPPQTLPSQEQQPEVYWLRMDGQQIHLVPQQVALNASASPEQALTEGVNSLLSQANTGDRSSAIPAGTRLLGLRVAPEGIYVDLSREFSQGGGSDSMIYRVAQILYTVTSLDPTAKVYFSIEGQVLDDNHPLGGEGLSLRQPLTRQQFVRDFPLS